MKIGLRALLALVLTALAAVAVAGSSDVLLDALLQRPRGEAGIVVVPDRFLRSWDPVTVFLPAARGPASGGPEDEPDKVVTLDPDWPGAWTWLDARTLQFRPAEPFPPLEVFTVETGGRTTVLSTLMTPPTQTTPRHGARGLDPVETIDLTFPEPLDPDALARMVTIEVKPLPGIGAGPARRLTHDDFEVKVLDRTAATDPARYALVLAHPIPLGRRAALRFGLSLDAGADEAVSEVVFQTAEPFRASALGCTGQTLPVGPDGTRYAADQPVRCTRDRVVEVEFTASPAAIGPIEGRNLVRFEPAVEDLEFHLYGRTLQVQGSFRPEVPYRVAIAPTDLRDSAGRPLELRDESVLWLYFPRRDPYLRWGAGQGIAERRGPQRFPLEGRGQGKADVRIYQVDPLNRSLWPFPGEPVVLDEAQRPPGPGEEPEAWTQTSNLTPSELRARLAALGSPGISEIVELPLDPDGEAARFGLDVAPMLQRLSGAGAAGHYLVGMRRLDGGTERAWVRLQVTDLALTTVENPSDVLFMVSSLADGAPVAGASVRIEGEVRVSPQDPEFQTLYKGTTDSTGSVRWDVPGSIKGRSVQVRRIVVAKGDDVLVVDPSVAPDGFRDGHWHDGGGTWLQWAFQGLEGRGESSAVLAHIFPERPIYRPGDEVHLKAFVRNRRIGRLSGVTGTGRIEVSGPGGTSWKLPVELTGAGSAYASWQEDEPPTGVYSASLVLDGPDGRATTVGSTSFRVEAYRLPTFEVQLFSPEGATQLPNDRPFDITLAASYYAGGRVAARPVRWRVTQYPFAWSPSEVPGFFWSSDDRYARGGRFRATPELSVQATTTARGEATLALDPGIEADARPRTYVVEATVTGADDQTVTETLRVHAVPAFVLGLKVPRFLDTAESIPAEVLVVGPDGKPVSGTELTLRLLHREWHSVLQASDFSDGEARYVTDVVDAALVEQTVASEAGPTKVALPIDEAGVYLVEVEARDALGRVQVVRVDLYAGGKGDLSWDKPRAGTFELTTDKDEYRPGDRAKVLVRSPFQRGEALVVVEAPDGNRYERVPVRGGKATVTVPIETGWVPRVPVHVVLRRGRADAPETGSDLDLGKPQTVAATRWLAVQPVENQVTVALQHPERALPGETIPMTVRLADPDGNPLAGEVTLWLVDQAVLALGEEQRLDPLPDFITDRSSHISVRDTRNLALGRVPYDEMPGGDGGDEEEEVLEKATIRKDFRPIAHYDPALKVPSSGTVTVQVKLPDNLTVFKVRAKAAAGAERFGVGTSQVAVRLPVVVQPTLPRFVRPGDAFEASGLVRVVEGDGGEGATEIAVQGLELKGAKKGSITLDPDLATRVGFGVTVPTPPILEDGALGWGEVTITLGATRKSDGASDAAQIVLPLEDDRAPRYARTIVDVKAGGTAELPPLPEEARERSVRRTVVVADHPGLVRMAGALDLVRRTEPRSTGELLARARVLVGLGELRGPLGIAGGEEEAEVRAAVEAASAWLPTVMDGRGLVASWPGSRGRVTLTAEALLFLVEAAEAGHATDDRLKTSLERTLEASLRSDYAYFLDGESWTERTSSLLALTTAGRFEEAYFSELARNSRYLQPEGQAMVLLAADRAGQGSSKLAVDLAGKLSDEVTVQLYRGEERYAGLVSRRTDRNPLIVPSESRQLATLVRALHRVEPDDGKLPVATDALVRLGGQDGWGQADADAAALLALAERLRTSPGADSQVRVSEGDASGLLVLDPEHAARSWISRHPGSTTLKHEGGSDAVAIGISRWIPAADGSKQAPEQRGFVVSREWQLVKASGPSDKVAIEAAGTALAAGVGDIVEEHVTVVCPETRHYVTVTVPLAAGMEPMNPALATAPPEARPAGRTTATPSYTAFYDDSVTYAFEVLPKGTFDFYFRTRASLAGSFVQPAARAEMIYDRTVVGLGAGARVQITGE